MVAGALSLAKGRPDEVEPSAVPLTNAVCLPLCVDLDGTLLRTNILVEGLVRLGLGRRLAQAALALARGRAAFKAAVAERAPVHRSRLPYHQSLLA
ncbi:hypothetical protein [Elioraea thermophila]|uniref:hypothetical protein n=1 Tax=Elioraea thermophila TaxID=2185104 RepID=UPI000DF42639|nr:hypothetical protein [Elioraea thermophila]